MLLAVRLTLRVTLLFNEPVRSLMKEMDLAVLTLNCDHIIRRSFVRSLRVTLLLLVL